VTDRETSPLPRQRIVVGLDGSPLAEAILDPVRILAARLGGDVVLLHVACVPESVRAIAPRAGVALDEVVAQERERAQRYLDGVAQPLRKAGISVRTVAVAGDPAAEIVRYAEREGIDLIALATHGRSGMQRWFYGSVTDAVLHTTTAPLLLIRPTDETVKPFNVRRIVVGLDGSELAEAALPIAERFARRFAVPLVLVRVVESSMLAFAGDPFGGVYVDYQRLFEILRDGAEQYLDTRAAEIRGRGVTVETCVEAGTAAEALVAQSQAHAGTLLVLSTHGRSGWRAIALGSVARRVVLVAASPVLIVRPPKPEQSTR
jgi:nucleotide-binding universal stress UspA family protein